MALQSEKGSSSRKPRVNLKDLKKLIDMMRKAELSEVNIEQEGIKIALKRGGEAQASFTALPFSAPAPAAPVPAWMPAPPASPAPLQVPPLASAEDPGLSVNSPMVGTFYRASSPDTAPYAEMGTRIEVGQTVCIIEAMKLMNEIKAEISGTVVKVCVDNAQPVEFGQPLFIIKP